MPIGERIKLARKRNLLSMDQLAQKANISKMAISKYESNKDIPGSSVLIRLARALDVSIEYLLRPEREEIQFGEFRRHKSLKVKEKQAILAQAQDWMERYLDVDEMIVGDSEEPILPIYIVESLEQIEGFASDLRREWNLGEDAIENITELLEDKNIRVGLVNASNDFDACTLYYKNIPVMAANANFPGDRQRFSLSHELGHLVLQTKPDLDEEKCAHRFASAFLIPGLALKQELGDKRSSLEPHELFLLKKKYGISMQALVYRAKDLEIIDEWSAARIFRQFSSKGWRLHEPGKPLPNEEPQKMKRLIYRGLAEELISPARAQELLGERIQSL